MMKTLRNSLVALILATSLLAAGGAWAWTNETMVKSVTTGSRTLLLEENITVKAGDQTEIRDTEGARIDFSEIPNPVDVAPGHVVVKVVGVRSGNTVNATAITVRPIVAQ
ncbi:MAG: hypothetical protein GY937_14640 [bacterium]|nr:hypothetical protein [bacterium]